MPGYPDRDARREDGVPFLLESELAGPPATCLEGGSRRFHRTERNYKVD